MLPSTPKLKCLKLWESKHLFLPGFQQQSGKMDLVIPKEIQEVNISIIQGLGIKFYTEEGNWDFVGNSTPVFWIKDPIKFVDLTHSRKRDPRTGLKNPNYLWDFISHSWESCHQNVINYSDRGTPDGYRHLHEYGTHAFRWENKDGEVYWVKIHIRTLSGIKNLSGSRPKELVADADYAQRDMVKHLDSGKTAEWELNIQAVP